MSRSSVRFQSPGSTPRLHQRTILTALDLLWLKPILRGYRVRQQPLLYCPALGVASSSLPAVMLPARSLLDPALGILNRRARSPRLFCHWKFGTTSDSLRMLGAPARNRLAAPLSIPTRRVPWRAR